MREIRFGPRNPLTKDLIMRNKMFIMREAGKSYVDYQVANAGGVEYGTALHMMRQNIKN